LWVSSNGWKKIRRRPSVKFWWLTWPRNQVQKLAMLGDYFKEDDNDDDDDKPQQK
jgi:hypothetical protein